MTSSDDAVRALEDQLRRDPQDVGLRLRLAAALREAGRDIDAVVHYHALARAYRSSGELRQATAVCHSALAIDPSNTEIRILLAQLNAEETKQLTPSQSRPPGVPPLRSLVPQVGSGTPWQDDIDVEHTEPSASVPTHDGADEPFDPEDLAVTNPRWDKPQPKSGVTKVKGSAAPEREPESDVGLDIARAFDRSFLEDLQTPGVALPPGGKTPFAGLPDRALAELSRGVDRLVVKSGDIILREGEPGDACFVIIHGEVRILKRDPVNLRGDLIEVARLGDGELFGEFALLADRRRHATVQAVRDGELFVISRRVLKKLSDGYPEIEPQLERFYRERLVHTLLATALFFKPLAPQRRQQLLSMFVPKKVDSGDEVIREGVAAGGFYLIILGAVEITKRVGKHQNVLIATLGEGSYFGELSLLRGDVARATVTAIEPLELAVLAPKAFYDVVSSNPELWDQVRAVAHQRELETHEIVAGLIGSV